jgi:GR25 family glycosyltransferase involved in LPS biosynthesis
MIPIYVINLENRIDRKEHILNEFQKHDIKNYTFTKAVHGHALDLDELENNHIIDRTGRTLNKGEYGCYISHLNILKDILNKPEEMHLIIEDDAIFVRNFNNKLKKLLKFVKDEEWDVFYLGINSYFDGDKEGEPVGRRGNGIYRPKNMISGTHGYLIKKSTVEKIINKLTPIKLAFDVALMEPDLDIKRITLLETIIKTPNAQSDTQTIK